MKLLASALFVALLSSSALAEMPLTGADAVRLSEMTSPEIRDAIKAGKTTVIIPTGGTEQNGPHLALGKHNFTLRYSSAAIALRLGDALVAPVLFYTPEGDFNPPTGNMRLPGTMGLRPETFALVLEDIARSLKLHGFKTICFVGEHGGSQSVQKTVADKLSAEWTQEHVKVIQVNNYYNVNGQNAYLASVGEKDPDPQAHGGLSDTSEMMAMHPEGVRDKLRGPYTAADMEKLGVEGPSDHASKELGIKLVDLKIEAAVKQIQKERSAP